MEDPYVQAIVTANATFSLPAGSKMSADEPNTVVCPNGDRLKFWVVCELYATDMGEVQENLSYQQLTQLGLDVEYDGTIINLVDIPESSGRSEDPSELLRLTWALGNPPEDLGGFMLRHGLQFYVTHPGEEDPDFVYNAPKADRESLVEIMEESGWGVRYTTLVDQPVLAPETP